MPPAPRIRPYKDFLTPALHRRFAMATATLFGLCYAEAVLIGEWNSCKISVLQSDFFLTPHSYLVLGSIRQSWHKNWPPLYSRLYDIHSSSSAIARGKADILFALADLHKICA